MTYCFDLDGTLCSITDGKYENATPNQERIDVVNKLYDQGHTILIDSARGSMTDTDWSMFTMNQLLDWDVKFHLVRTGEKLEADIYIDDRGRQDLLFFGDYE